MGTIRRLVALAVIGGGALLAGPAVAGADVLYDQTDSAATPNANSASPNYSPSNLFSVGNYDRTADDFMVPDGATWSINEVDVTGAYNANPGSVVNVYIYPDAGGQPGTASFTQEGITAAGGPNYQVPLTGVPNLTAGRYWITVQQDASGGGGYWSWGTRSVQSGAAAQWFRTAIGIIPCPTNMWTLRAACWPSGSPDQTFELKGTNLNPPLNSISLGKLALNKKAGTAKLTVKVPGPGTLVLSGKTVVKQRFDPRQAGSRKLLVKAKGKAKRKLNSAGKVKVKVKVAYTPAGGTTSTKTKTIKLVKRLG